MENYRTEEEQVEALKRWWQENGRSTVVAIVLAAGLGLGWQGWQRSQEAAAEDAALRYQGMVEVLDAAQSPDSADSVGAADPRALAEALRDDQGGSIYGQFAGLHLARLAVQDNDLETAEEMLRWVMRVAEGSVAATAQLRLARVLAARGDTDAALQLLDSAADDSFAAAYAIARGDALLAAGRHEDALSAYRTAEAELGGSAAGMAFPQTLRDKIDYLDALSTAVETVSGAGDAGAAERG